jgi:hypothetical protein
MNTQQQITEIEKNASRILHPEMLFEMNRKYRELQDKKSLDKVFYININ